MTAFLNFNQRTLPPDFLSTGVTTLPLGRHCPKKVTPGKTSYS